MAMKSLEPGSVDGMVAELMFEPCAGMAARVLLFNGAMKPEEVAASAIGVMRGYGINHSLYEAGLGIDYLRAKGLVSEESDNLLLNPAGVAVAKNLWGVYLAVTGREPHPSYRSNI